MEEGGGAGEGRRVTGAKGLAQSDQSDRLKATVSKRPAQATSSSDQLKATGSERQAHSEMLEAPGSMLPARKAVLEPRSLLSPSSNPCFPGAATSGSSLPTSS